MSDFDLDLKAVEEHIEDDEDEDLEGRVVLGILDGTTEPTEWVRAIEDGHVLVLAVDGDVNDRAAPFARDVKDHGGNLVHFRGFLIVAPPGITVDTDRL